MSDSERAPRMIAQNLAVGPRGVVVGGNVVGSTIVTGDVSQQEAATLEEFLALLHELRDGVRRAFLEPEVAQDLVAEVESVERQAGSEHPSPLLIFAKLETMNAALRRTPGGENLVPIALRLGEMASASF